MYIECSNAKIYVEKLLLFLENLKSENINIFLNIMSIVSLMLQLPTTQKTRYSRNGTSSKINSWQTWDYFTQIKNYGSKQHVF